LQCSDQSIERGQIFVIHSQFSLRMDY